ncbi:hypothetical protein NTE_03377 [Candidatus Nitrososphaera evergladensis SR1]|uniref:Uncharacterized protein n=1 Tax=Candidatus Nitrososphaera evergladensis SR1 TaxID=1459636 RepID=A0A075MVX3_9ARCH|nr:hypothetical protein [Candidatus Nitrososphaera evergladensis]AIF85405.1 hypothetical protein NTE_03377 [Candidatus Nitrososphaera evergladensis SR1]
MPHTIHVLVHAVALAWIGAILFFVPPLSTSSLPAIASLPPLLFWIVAWFADAGFTAKHWRLVMEGREANVLVLVLARLAPRKSKIVFAVHAAFSVGVATGLQSMVTHTFDLFLVSSILAAFGVLHLDAFFHSRTFVRTTTTTMMMGSQASEQQNPAEKETKKVLSFW